LASDFFGYESSSNNSSPSNEISISYDNMDLAYLTTLFNCINFMDSNNKMIVCPVYLEVNGRKRSYCFRIHSRILSERTEENHEKFEDSSPASC
jgi:hypothetical protein